MGIRGATTLPLLEASGSVLFKIRKPTPKDMAQDFEVRALWKIRDSLVRVWN